MKRFTGIFVVIALLGFAGGVMAQSHQINITIPTISLIDVSAPGTAVNFSVTAPALAGDAPTVTGSPNTDKQVYYTSLVGTGLQREIQAAMASLPAGLNLNVAVAAATGGAGTRGSGTNADFTSLDLVAKNVVTGIRSCYSSRTAGGAVTYSLTISDFSTLVTQVATDHQITYTLTAAH